MVSLTRPTTAWRRCRPSRNLLLLTSAGKGSTDGSQPPIHPPTTTRPVRCDDRPRAPGSLKVINSLRGRSNPTRSFGCMGFVRTRARSEILQLRRLLIEHDSWVRQNRFMVRQAILIEPKILNGTRLIRIWQLDHYRRCQAILPDRPRPCNCLLLFRFQQQRETKSPQSDALPGQATLYAFSSHV